MTKDEAEKVATIMLQADGGCGHCAFELMKLFVAEFPEYEELTKKVYESEYYRWSDDN